MTKVGRRVDKKVFWMAEMTAVKKVYQAAGKRAWQKVARSGKWKAGMWDYQKVVPSVSPMVEKTAGKTAQPVADKRAVTKAVWTDKRLDVQMADWKAVRRGKQWAVESDESMVDQLVDERECCKVVRMDVWWADEKDYSKDEMTVAMTVEKMVAAWGLPMDMWREHYWAGKKVELKAIK